MGPLQNNDRGAPNSPQNCTQSSVECLENNPNHTPIRCERCHSCASQRHPDTMHNTYVYWCNNLCYTFLPVRLLCTPTDAGLRRWETTTDIFSFSLSHPPSLGGAWRVQACEMVKKVTKPGVRKLSDLQVNTLSRLYGLPYNSRGGSVSEKAERVWGELVRRIGGSVAATPEAVVPSAVWHTAVETKRYLPWTELAAALRALEQLHGEEPFELPKSKGSVSQIVQQWESASLRKGQKSIQDEGTSTSTVPKQLAISTAGGRTSSCP